MSSIASPATFRQYFAVWLKFLVAAGLVFWIFQKADLLKVWSTILSASPGMVIAGIALCLCTVLIAGWRWKQLLKIVGLNVPLASLVWIAQIGQFFMMFLPGPLGDDFTRMFYIFRLANGRAGEACTTVVLDRVIGLAAVLVLAVVCLPAQWALLGTSLQTRWLALGIGCAGAFAGAAGLVFFLLGAPTSKWVEVPLRLIPSAVVRGNLLRIWGYVSANKWIVGQVVFAALLTQVLVCGMFALAGRAVGIMVPNSVWFSFVPILLAASAIPITVAGIGVREYVIVLFLGVLSNVDKEIALAASLVAFLMMFVVGLFGGIAYLFYRPKAHLARDLRAEEDVYEG